jgi:hypothetical protein
MYWLGLLIVAPVWAMLSAQLLLMGILAFANFVIAIVGLCKKAVSLRVAAAALTAASLSAILYFSLLIAGFYFLTHTTSFGRTFSEKIVYGVVVLFSVIYMAPEFIYKTRKQWRSCMIPGALELDIARRRWGS